MREPIDSGRVNSLHDYDSCVHTYVQPGLGHIKSAWRFPAQRKAEPDEHMARALSIKENPWVFSELSGFVELLFRWSCGKSGTGGLSGSVQCWTFFPSVKTKCYFSLLSLPQYSTCFPLQLQRVNETSKTNEPQLWFGEISGLLVLVVPVLGACKRWVSGYGKMRKSSWFHLNTFAVM